MRHKIIGTLALACVLVFATGVQAQRCKPCERNFPHFNNPQINGVVHDAGHALTSVVVYEGLGLIGLPRSPLVRMVIATVGVPLVQETVDAIQYPRYSFGSLDSMHDWLTYQGAWSVYLAERGEWGWAAATFVAYVGALYAWNYTYKGDWGVSVRVN